MFLSFWIQISFIDRIKPILCVITLRLKHSWTPILHIQLLIRKTLSWINTVSFLCPNSWAFKMEVMERTEVVKFVYFEAFPWLVNDVYWSRRPTYRMLLQSFFHIWCCQNIMTLRTVFANGRLERAKNPVAYVLSTLGLGKIILFDGYSNSLSNISHCSNQQVIVITPCLIRPKIDTFKRGAFSFQMR